MTFQEASDRLAALANGEYRSIHYEVTTNNDGNAVQKCTAYIHGHGLKTANTWEFALAEMMISVATRSGKYIPEEQPTEEIPCPSK